MRRSTLPSIHETLATRRSACNGTDSAGYRCGIEALGYLAGAVCAICVAIIFAMSSRIGRVVIVGALVVVALGFTAFALYVTGVLAGLAS
jgi:hypothetical protein